MRDFSGVFSIKTTRKLSRDGVQGYRMVLFGAGVMSDRSQEGGIDWEASRAVLQAGGKLPLPELLRLRFRYFNEGVALGSREFIDRLRAEHPAFSGRKGNVLGSHRRCRRMTLPAFASPGVSRNGDEQRGDFQNTTT